MKSLPNIQDNWIQYALIGVWLCNCILASVVAVREVWIPHMDAWWDNYTNIRSAPFDGTVMPIRYIPDWTKVENQDKTRRFEDISISDYLSLPSYDPITLASDLNNTTKTSTILHYTYTVPYMGSYTFNYKEHDGSHLGVDIRAPIGTPILSIANGVVVRTVEADSTGNKFVVIRHDDVPMNGWKTSLYSGYLHLSQITVTEWTRIKKWDMLGRVGITGITTTPHLHFQIDTIDAPFHPYWPFTSADSRNAGLGFFESVNAGLGKENALKYTINPLGFINQYLWWIQGSNISSTVISAPISATIGTTISESLTDEQAIREREIMLGSYTSTPVSTCQSYRFPDVRDTSTFWKMLYELVDDYCLFQKSGNFDGKASITNREALQSIMDYYKIAPGSGISHFLDMSINDPLQGYLITAYRQGILDGNYFFPDRILTRGEVMDLIVKIGNIPANPGQIRIYPDVTSLNKHYQSVQAYGLAVRVRGGRFYPDTIMTRSSFVQFLSTLKKIQK